MRSRVRSARTAQRHLLQPLGTDVVAPEAALGFVKGLGSKQQILFLLTRGTLLDDLAELIHAGVQASASGLPHLAANDSRKHA